jgi:hypothetical protein
MASSFAPIVVEALKIAEALVLYPLVFVGRE